MCYNDLISKKQMLFKNLLNELPMIRLFYLIGQHNTDRYKKTFSTFQLFKSLLLMQILWTDSIREFETSVKTKRIALKEQSPYFALNLDGFNRSTFSYTNTHCDSFIFKEFFYECLHYFESKSYWKQFQSTLNIPLFALDSSTISLPLKLCNWATYKETKWWIKVHALLRDGYIPEYIEITEANVADVTIWRQILKTKIPQNSCAVFDLWYVDYRLYADLSDKNVFFVSRAKDNMKYEIIDTWQINNMYENWVINYEQDIRCYYKNTQHCTKSIPLRIINATVLIEWKPKKFNFITNNFDLTPEEVAECYRLRWRIELFFKFIKQNLVIKSFVWNNRNAVENQIRVASIFYLFISYLHFLCKSAEKRIRFIQSIKACVFNPLSILDILWISEYSNYKPPGFSVWSMWRQLSLF